jgi:hypothetical protein
MAEEEETYNCYRFSPCCCSCASGGEEATAAAAGKRRRKPARAPRGRAPPDLRHLVAEEGGGTVHRRGEDMCVGRTESNKKWWDVMYNRLHAEELIWRRRGGGDYSTPVKSKRRD